MRPSALITFALVISFALVAACDDAGDPPNITPDSQNSTPNADADGSPGIDIPGPGVDVAPTEDVLPTEDAPPEDVPAGPDVPDQPDGNGGVGECPAEWYPTLVFDPGALGTYPPFGGTVLEGDATGSFSATWQYTTDTDVSGGCNPAGEHCSNATAVLQLDTSEVAVSIPEDRLALVPTGTAVEVVTHQVFDPSVELESLEIQRDDGTFVLRIYASKKFEVPLDNTSVTVDDLTLFVSEPDCLTPKDACDRAWFTRSLTVMSSDGAAVTLEPGTTEVIASGGATYDVFFGLAVDRAPTIGCTDAHRTGFDYWVFRRP